MYAPEPVITSDEDDFHDDGPNVLHVPADQLTMEQLRQIVSAGANPGQLSTLSRASLGSERTQMMSPLDSPASTARVPASMQQHRAPVNRSSPRRSTTTPMRQQQPSQQQAASAASNWSAAVWSSGAPASVHSSPVPHCTSLSTTREAPPRPRTAAPQAWNGTPPKLHAQSGMIVAHHPGQPDARACAAAFTAAAAMSAHNSPGAEAGRRPTTSMMGAGMAPPKETARERRLQQQRDALSHAVGMAQSSAAEAAVRVELLRSELNLAEDQSSRSSALVAGVAAEKATMRSQLDALTAELRIARQANERLTSERLTAPHERSSIAHARGPSPAQARATVASEARSRMRPDGGRGRGGVRGRGGGGPHSGAVERRLVLKEERPTTALVEAVTQTSDDDDVLGTAVPRAAQAEVAGLRAEVLALREQITAAASRRKHELEGGERAHQAAMASHGTSALHARLLWSEAHQLEEALSEAGSTLARERREAGGIIAKLEADLLELKGTQSQLEVSHQQQLARAKADRRVLHRNSRDFLEGKHTVERQRDALEEQLASFEEQRGTLMRDQKEKARLIRTQATSLQEHEVKIQTLERSLGEARKALRSSETTSEANAKQGRADREVLVECVRQMASQLAAARAANEASNGQLLQAQTEAAERLRAAEDGSAAEAQTVTQLRAQLEECERQLQNEVERGQSAGEAAAATLRRAAEREAELEQQLSHAEERARLHDEAIEAAHRDADATAANAKKAGRNFESIGVCHRTELHQLQAELRAAEAQLDAAVSGHSEALGAHGRLTSSVSALEVELAQARAAHNTLQSEYATLQRAHTALATEGAHRSQLVETLGATAREVKQASEASNASLSADLAAAEALSRQMGDARDRAVADLSAERAEHESNRLQLISAQSALQRSRQVADETIATEGVRLALALDELRRADRLAGVIHRSLNDAMRGSAEAAGLSLTDCASQPYTARSLALAPPTSSGREIGQTAAPPPGAAIRTHTPLTRRGVDEPEGKRRLEARTVAPTHPAVIVDGTRSPSPERFSSLGGSSGLGGGSARQTSPTRSARQASPAMLRDPRLSPAASPPSLGGSAPTRDSFRPPPTRDDGLGDLSARRAAIASGRNPSMAGDERASLDVRGDGTAGSGFAAASEALGWLRNDSHQDRLRRLREKYGYE